MFWPKATTLQHFYTSPTGRVIGKRIEQKISQLWAGIRHETLIGVGFAIPHLEVLPRKSNHIALFLPEAQGCIYWPEKAHNKTCLTSEYSLPLADNSVNRIILAHTLEYTDHPHLVIREMWRVLAPSGKLLVITPNRLGAWAHLGRTPFASGRAFHLFELITLLQDAFFLPLYTGSLLFAPPAFPHLLVKSSLWENIGNFWLQPFGGLLMAEGEKQLYSVPPTEGSKSKNPLRLLIPTTA